MLDTMTLTKIVGGFCGALLVFLLGKWVAESIYHVGGGHGGEEQAYVIEVEEAGGDEPAEEVNFDELMASADAGAGEKVFGKCKACHKLDGTDGVGPHLNGVVGRAIDGVSGYGYSGALLQVGDTWTVENLNAFLESPKNAAPGTKMGFAGLGKPEDRANVIAYLQGTEG